MEIELEYRLELTVSPTSSPSLGANLTGAILTDDGAEVRFRCLGFFRRPDLDNLADARHRGARDRGRTLLVAER